MGPSCFLRIDPDEKKAQSNLLNKEILRHKTSFRRDHINWVIFRTVDELYQ